MVNTEIAPENNLSEPMMTQFRVSSSQGNVREIPNQAKFMENQGILILVREKIEF